MASERHISYDELSADLGEVIEHIIRTREKVVVETDGGAIITLQASVPEGSQLDDPSQKTAEDYEAFLSAAGSWKDVDTDRLLKDIYASRRSSRPPVDL